MDERTRENLTRGREHYAAREYGKAEPFLAEIAEGNLDFADVYDMLGVIYHQQGRLTDAEIMFQRALGLNPNYTEAALNLAVTYNDLGKYKEAKDIYARAMSVSKNAPKQLDPFRQGKNREHARRGGERLSRRRSVCRCHPRIREGPVALPDVPRHSHQTGNHAARDGKPGGRGSRIRTRAV